MNKILVLEDEEDIASIEQEYLEMADFEVTVCHDGVTGMEEALTNKYDLVLIDINIPGIDGLFVCKKLREKLDIPLLMVTGKQDAATQIMAFEIGADDYITKPFEPGVLVARVKAHLKQVARYTKLMDERSHVTNCGSFTIDESTRRICKNGEVIDLKYKEYELLLFFIKNHEQVFTREDLYEEIWGLESEGESATVAVHINRLRHKIEDDPAEPKHIQTVWGMGYRFSL